jgi:hypothetical protein
VVLAENLKTYFQLVFALREFLKETLTLEKCKEIVKRRLEERDKNFIDIVKRTIYDNETSPYLKLLKLAGCEFGDFRSCVIRDGVEKTLEALRQSGVYLTYDEFKGRKDVIREGKSFRFEQSDFNNPTLSHHLTVRTGGTTGPGVKVPVAFEYIAQVAVHQAFLFDIHRLWDAPFAMWFPIFPGAAGVNTLLRNTKAGKPPLKWFSQIDREYINPSLTHKLRTNGLVYTGRFFGGKFPRPEFVDLNSASKIAEWIAKMIKKISQCYIATFPSSAVRICNAVKEYGLNIEGTTFVIVGEPITPTKYNEIKSVGANVVPQYGFTEASTVGFGCAEPEQIDEVHFFRDSFALIQHKRKPPYLDKSIGAFLFTSLLSRAPKILFNVETGDYGVLKSRKCGCGFEDLGLMDHIHSIRSFEKITSEGMNLAGFDLVRLIEEVLPRKHGGDSTDYQIVEEEDENGFSRLIIIVSPDIGPINEKNLLQTILDNIKTSFIPEIFSQAGTFCMKRVHPVSTESGKIFPLHIKRKGIVS